MAAMGKGYKKSNSQGGYMIGVLGFIAGTIVGLIFGVLIVIAALQGIGEK